MNAKQLIELEEEMTDARKMIERVMQGEDPNQVVEAKALALAPPQVQVGPWDYFEDIDYRTKEDGLFVPDDEASDYEPGELEIDDSSFMTVLVGIPPASLNWGKKETNDVVRALKSARLQGDLKPSSPYKKFGGLRLLSISSNEEGEQVTKNQKRIGEALRTSVVNALRRAGFEVIDNPKLKEASR